MDERTKTIDGIVRNKAGGEQWAWAAVAAAYDAGEAAARERCAQIVEDYPMWIGNNAKREIAAAVRGD